MKGIILAGGKGTRLYPSTKAISKHLFPIYNKPMIYYPLSIFMLAEITDILIITTQDDKNNFINLLDDGKSLGLNLQYMIQDSPNGIPEAFVIAEEFIGDDDVSLILGDNLFYGNTFVSQFITPHINNSQNVAFSYYVNDPHRYGIVEHDENGNIVSLEEKPKEPKSNYALTGLYIFTNDIIQISKSLKPSKRGELEIIDVLNEYFKQDKLIVQPIGRGVAWFDTGTNNSLLAASNFIEAIETRQGLQVACLEEIAFIKGYITKDDLYKLAIKQKNSEYGQYILNRVLS